MKNKVKEKICHMIIYYREKGLRRFVRHAISRLFHREEMSYKRWRRKHRLSRKEIEEQKKTKFMKEPLISILVPLYCTPEQYLRELIESVQGQTYSNWELCLSDGSGMGKIDYDYLNKCIESDKRIKLISSEAPLSISANTNQALKIATGDYIAFADHDDLLQINTLFECVKAINEHPEIELIYTDEDKVSMDGKTFFQPHFKSDFNLDLLRSMNYICHFLIVKRELQYRVGQFCEEYNGAQDYDFVLRCIENSQHIYHIPKILYHWRAHQDSTAENPESKRYAFEAGKRAIEAHLKRCGENGIVEMGEYLGIYRVRYSLEKEPLVSILIPNKDHVEDLKRCVWSLLEVSNYDNIEIIVIENGSREEKTFSYYNKISENNSKVVVLNWKGEQGFNYAALNNFGADYAKGDYLLFLNNDTEVINSDCIREMVSLASRADVGAVGARLYYPDGTIQHAGVILGLGKVAGHAFKDSEHDADGYFSRIKCIQDYSAVTAACMMMPKILFEKIGGFDEIFKVAFNDVDLCMRIREQKKLIVYTPFAELYHYESKSRGLDNTREKKKRFNKEIACFISKWGKELDAGDPYYNPNLTVEAHDFSLKIL